MKLTITIESDQIYTDLLSCLSSIKTVAQIAETSPEILEPDACGDLSVQLCRPWDFDEDKPAPFGEMVITR